MDYPSQTSVKTASVGTYLSLKILGGGVPPGSPNPDPISNPKKCHFSHPFSDLASNIHARFQIWSHYLD